MKLPRRFLVAAATTTFVCALLVGNALAEPSRSAGRAKGAQKARVAKARTATRPVASEPPETDRPLAARVHSALVYYGALASWQLRDELDPSTYAVARRALALVAGLASARPGAGLADALSPAPPILERRPVPGAIRSGYGVRRDPFRRRRRERHNGVDLIAGRGVPVHAAGPGMVVKAERTPGYGRVVYLDHGMGVQTRYAHLQKIAVQEGQFVPPGALVGQVGSSGHATGPHLHFEVRRKGQPVAPAQILDLLPADAPLYAWVERLMGGAGGVDAAGDAARAASKASIKKVRSRTQHEQSRKRDRSHRQAMRTGSPTS